MTGPSLLGLAFFLWALVAVTWSPTHRVTDWVKAAGAIALVWIVGRGLAHMPALRLQHLANAVIVAVLALFVLLTVERVTGGFLIGLVRVQDPTARLFDIMSPGLVVLSCLAFPTAFLLQQRVQHRAWAPAFVFACFALGLVYRMDAAPVALASAAIAYAIARVGGRLGFVAVALGITVIALLWGSVASLAWEHGEQAWLTHIANYNWGYRVEIWHRVQELIRERFWLGYGFDSTRILGNTQPPETVFLHPHNGLLQVWLELGVVGVALLLAWVAVAARRFLVSTPHVETQAVAAATITAVSVFWLISFGIWHREWWICTIGLSACAIVLARRVAAVR